MPSLASVMASRLGAERTQSQDPGLVPSALWPVDLKLTHVDWNPEATLIHFQGHYVTICDLDYSILQGEIQNIPKKEANFDVGDFCLVEDFITGCWYRGRVQNINDQMFDAFLIDHGNVLSVDATHLSSGSNDIFILPAKIICGFFANVMPLQDSWDSVVENYFFSLIGKNITGYIQALLPHKVLILEAPEINKDLIRLGFGKYVDTDTFLLLVKMLTEVPLNQNIEPVPDFLIEKPKRHKFSFNSSSTHGFEDILSFCGAKMSAGTRVQAKVTAAVNPMLFYCQMTSMAKDLQAMSEKLAKTCESRTRMSQENLGLLSSVKGKDEKWYRGFVQFLPVNSQVQVLFVDYGFSESVRVENVHRLPANFLSKPIFAFPCSLSCMTDQNEAAKSQQLSYLKKGLLGSVLDVEIICFNEEQKLYTILVHGIVSSSIRVAESNLDFPEMKVEMVSMIDQMLSPDQFSLYVTIHAEVLLDAIQGDKIHIGSKFVGYVEHTLNPTQFWLRTEKRNKDFEEMMKKITDHFSRVKLEEDVLENPDLGTLCCAMYEKDMHYYRAVVTDNLEHGSEVLFIDFGNTEKVPHMLIKKIPEQFYSEPAFALCCTLANVLPICEVWTSANTDLFKQAVTNRALLVNVLHLRLDKVVVELYNMGNNPSQSISELLISSNQAEYWKYIPSKSLQKNEKKMSEKTDGHPKNKSVTAQWGACKQKNENLIEVKTEMFEQNKSEIPITKMSAKFKPLHLKPGCDFAVHCSHINCPSDFWCQLQINLPTLDKLMDNMHQYYRTNAARMQYGESCCVVKSPDDGKWYRACIIGQQMGSVKVILVDYGMIVQISEHNVKAILPEHLDLESQAFRCSIHPLIEPVHPKSCSEWSTEACTLFWNFVQDTIDLRCCVVSHIVNSWLHNVVDLYNATQSLTKTLVEKGLAREVVIPTKLWSSVHPLSFTYSSFNLSNGSKEPVYICYLRSPLELYFQLDRNCEIIEEIGKRASVEGEKKHAKKQLITGLCLAKYWDGKWYRGLAAPVQSPQHLSVYFVDYGNKEIIEKSSVKCIPIDATDLLYTPMQAVRCSLFQVPKKELPVEVKQWLEVAILNKPLKVIIVDKHEDGAFSIELIDGDIHINDKVKEHIASLTQTQTTKTVVTVNSSCQKLSLKSFKSIVSTGSPAQPACPVKKSKEKRMVPSKCPNPGAKTRRTRGHQVIKNQEKHEITKSEQLSPSGLTSKMPTLSSLPKHKVNAGLSALCYVSHVDNVDSFFLQMQEDEPDILKMAENLDTDLRRDSLMKTELVDLKVNDLVLAEFEDDGALYRAVVKGLEATGSLKVEFLDYGNVAVVRREKTYLIKREYLSQPRLCIQCSLQDPVMYETGVCFADTVMEKLIMVDFSQFGTQWEVKIEIHDDIQTPQPESTDNNTDNNNEIPIPAFLSVNLFEMAKIQVSMQSCVALKEETNQKKHFETHMAMSSHSTLSINNRTRCIRKPSQIMRDTVDGPMALNIEERTTETGTLLSVLENGNFYVRLDKTTNLLATLERHIAESLKQCHVVTEVNVKEGLRCLMKHHKDVWWHRAVVQHVEEGKCQVALVDHGITNKIPINSLRDMCTDLTQIPSLAVLCKLNNLGFSVENGCKMWQEVLTAMVDTHVKLVFVSYSQADNLWMVEIAINGLFFIPLAIQTSREFTDDVAPIGTRTGTGMSEEHPCLKATPLQQLFFAPVYMDQAYDAFALAVTSPFDFCVILKDHRLVINTLSIMLNDLSGKMSTLPETHLIPGSCCLLKPDSMSKWCRAEIVHANNTMIANLVDYGLCMDVTYENRSMLKTLPEELSRQPKVNYPCILRGVKPVSSKERWTEEAAVFFQQCMHLKNLQIFFREFVSDIYWEVDILADSVPVAYTLVDSGHASYIDGMLGIRFQPASPSIAAPQTLSTEDDYTENKNLDERSDLSAVATCSRKAEEAQSPMVSESSQCFLM